METGNAFRIGIERDNLLDNMFAEMSGRTGGTKSLDPWVFFGQGRASIGMHPKGARVTKRKGIPDGRQV